MDQRGIIDLPLKVNGLEIKISPVAPLAMAQNMDDVQSMLQYAEIAQQSGPQGQATLKVDVMLDYIAEIQAVQAKVRTTPEERALAEQQALQAAQQMAEQNPEAAAGVAEQMMQQQG